MEWVKDRLKEFTIRLEEITDIFVHKIGGQSHNIYFCAKLDDKMSCYRNGSLPEDAKDAIEKSMEYFSINKEDPIYIGDTYYVTDKISCYKYLDGDFIVAFHVELENTPNTLLKEYFDTQIKNYLLYIVPLIYFNKDLYPEFFLESHIYAVTKTLVEEKINHDNLYKLNYVRTKKVSCFTVIDQLSTMTYEGEYLHNKCLIFAHNTKCDIEICNNINFREIKKVRKLLEITYRKSKENYLGLLCDIDSMEVKGLISPNGLSNYTMIVFIDKGKWSIICEGNELAIADSKVHFSNKKIDESNFKTIFINKFGNRNVNSILDIVKSATSQKHGTMIVISDSAEKEMERLNSTGYEVKYSKVENRYIEQITAIDGSVLVNPDGDIVGIGVILDGELSEECDINNSRGARYNSAIKYTYTRNREKENCMAVVISEDGDISIVIDGKEK